MNPPDKADTGNTKTPRKENITAELINPIKPGRLLSLDALRGFDMFMIIGGGHLIQQASHLNDWGWLQWLAGQMDHTRWHGLTFYDIIFPLFLFISGVSLAYSLASQLKKGRTKKEVYLHAFRRMIILMVIGILYKNQPLHFDWGQIRYVSVLGRIGFTGFCVTLIFTNAQNFQQRLYWMFGLLVAYWAAMMFIPVPGFGAGNLTIEGNLAGFIDRIIVPGKKIQGIFDENGYFEHIPATALVLMGAMTGEFLRTSKFADNKKVLWLAGAGVVAIALGLLWGLHFPINKRLWSSSFILATGGACLLMLSLFYWIIDVRGHKKWAFFFVVIGLNSIVAYLAGHFINFAYTADYLLNGFYQLSSESVQNLLRELGVLTLEWLLLYFLYKKRIFVKV